MPQGEETFLYRIVTQLDDEQAFSQVSQELSMIADKTEQAEGQMQNLLSEMRKMGKSDLSRVQEQLQQLKGPTDISGLKDMKGDLQALEKNLEDGTEASRRLNKVIEGVESADFKVLSDNVDDLENSLTDTSTIFRRIENQLQKIGSADDISEARQRFQRLKKMILENEEVITRLKNEGNFDAMAQRVSRLNDVFEDTKNSVAIAGGSIEKRLGTSLDGVNTQVDKTRLKTNQMSQAILQGAQDAQFGVIGVANNIQMLGESISRQMNKGVSGTRLLKSTLSNLFMGPMAIGTLITTLTLLAQNWDDVRAAGVEALQAIGLEIQKQQGELSSLAEDVRNLDENIGDVSGKDFVGFFKNLAQNPDLLQKTRKRLNEVRNQLAPFRSVLGGTVEDTQNWTVSVEGLLSMLGSWTLKQEKAARAVGMTQEEIESLQDTEDVLSTVLKKANAQSMEELKLRQQLSEVYGVNTEKAKNLADAILELQESQGLSDFEKSVLEAGEDFDVGETAQEDPNAPDVPDDLVFFKDYGLVQPSVADRIREQTLNFLSGDWLVDLDVGQTAQEDPNAPDVPDDLVWFSDYGFVQPSVARRLRKKAVDNGKDQMQKAQEAFRAEQERLRGMQQILDQRSELGPQESSLFGLGVAELENKADERLQFQMQIAREEKNIQKARLQNQQSLLDERFTQGKIKWQQWMRETANVQKQIAMTEQQWYRKRENMQDQHVKKKIRRASQFGQEFLGQTSSFASTWFNTWKNEREQELKQQGKTEKERRKILKEEGKKRFQFMKNVKIAEASADTIAGVAKTIGNYPFPYWIPLAAAHAAAGAARVNKIAQLSIGDKIGGGGAAGAGGSASNLTGEFTQLTPDRNARRANNLANASRRSQASQRRSEADKMQRAAQKMDKAARKIQKTKVTYDDKTAEDITERGQNRQESLNI